MKPEGRQILEYVIKQLDGELKSPVKDGSFRAQAEKIDTQNAELFKQSYTACYMSVAAQLGRDLALGHMLIGKNKLTPCLVSRGWKFWEQPLLTESEKNDVELAHLRYSKGKNSQIESLHQELNELSNKDERAGLIVLSSMLDIDLLYMQQLSADLKRILTGAIQ